MDQLVVLKGQRDGISILLDSDADFEKIEEEFRKKVAAAKEFFDGANSRLAFKGRVLEDKQEQKLLDIIISETTLDVGFIESEGFVRPIPKAVQETPANVTYNKSDTAFYRSGLRSGQSIRYNGSVVIVGDVNPGSEVVAAGNVVVLGTLRGMVHAGSRGDETCFISALVLKPTQLRIGKVITYIPSVNAREDVSPECAYIQDGQVFIAQL